MIARHGAGLAELGRRHSPSTPVPTCGDWRLADLVWHLAEVQDFWCHVIGNRPAGPDSYDRPSRPADDELGDLLADRCRRLVSLLTDADPAEHAWSWADEQTVGFTVRRQSHEALVHHVDGLLAVGEPVPTVDPALGADGVDELVGVMLTGVPPWATFTRGTGTIRLDAGGAGRSWSLRFGRMTGTSPTTGTDHNLAALERIDDLDRADTVIEAPALDLDLWMWGRLPDEHVSVAGDPDAVARLRQTIAESTQ